MNLLIENVSDLNDMIMQGEVKEAFERFYHDDVVIQHNDEAPVIGKEANRKIKESDLQNIIELKCAKPLKVTIGEQATMVEWQFLDQHKIFGERNFTQVAVHEWDAGLIIKEKLYCGNKQK
ncbi:nuclear transport factor 2 family protein [Lutimonas zeaxanthinifaciens]|uniref:nuclear transport factor 2 family protein n=1 Tax=Lutimonas zeaxanthinifaciens TaxID=3060215 RepID=UPI00265CD67B|nr:nuclear transport factor 2 family protein [Lutimonas sp. YSD2104]WKK66433.1 nuclear transport factor 2 family protein [Lutimonas sp. YSD2104]